MLDDGAASLWTVKTCGGTAIRAGAVRIDRKRALLLALAAIDKRIAFRAETVSPFL